MSDTVCRALTIPFTPVSCDWPTINKILSERCWPESTALANWAVLELVKHDVVRTPALEKLPAYPKCSCRKCAISKTKSLYLYGHFAKYEHRSAWTGAAQAANCVLRSVQRKYLQERFDLIWRRAKALPTYRYPFPFPIHNQSWKPFYGQGNVPQVSLSLPGGNVVLRIRQGQEFRRQLVLFGQLVRGEAKAGEAVLLRRRGRTLLKLVYHIAKRPVLEASGTLVLTTWPDTFWTAQHEGRTEAAWRLNADHIRRLVAAHESYLQRISEDTKYEKRVPRKQRRHIDQAREERCAKHADRIKDFIHVATKEAVGYAVRQKIARVLFDYSCREYLPKFPWRQVEEILRYKLDDYGIALVANPGSEEGSMPDEGG